MIDYQHITNSNNKFDGLEENIPYVKPMEVEISESEIYFREKIERIDKAEAQLPKDLIGKDVFSPKEEELKVLFPKEFKDFYKPNKSLREYRFLDINDFRTEDEYYDRYPETYKAVIVAENGLGDSIGLILSKDSDFLLRPEFYEFSHETGEVEKYRNIPKG